ncbi:MAG: hypothetical protein LBT30_00925 [Clostridiales bacterium]|jgi:uncharacterized membrane protein (DUF485 family)|nr:hypothetical protein [Clostridiales bacterium]
MNCFIHEDRTAVATCMNCGKAMCSDCVSFFDTPGSQNYGFCPVCRKNDVANEKLTLERIRNDFWIKSKVELRKAKNRALAVLFFGIIITAIWLTLELAFDVVLLELIGLTTEPIAIPLIDASVTWNALLSVLPTLICIVLFILILVKADKKSYKITLQGNAYEVSRFELDKSLQSIDTALVKNRSNVKRL